LTDTSLARAAFRADWAHLAVAEIDALLAEEAGRLADLTGGTRSLDAIPWPLSSAPGRWGSRW